MDSVPSSSEEESSECDLGEDNDVEVVWAKSARGVWGLGNVFDANCISLMIYVRKSGSLRIWQPQRSRCLPPRQEQSQPLNRLVRLSSRPLNAAKPAPCSIASSSSAGATHPGTVMQSEHLQQFKVCDSRTQKFFTIPLDPQ